MAITPDTDIRILKVPLSIDNKNQLTFVSKQAQETYFKSLPYIEMNNCTYLRKDSVIRFYGHIDDLIEYNYVMYKNNNYSDKYFYAFITGMRYENNNMTSIFIATDVFQTWQFDFTFKESFIEREMLSKNDDVPGANLVPEGLETGEFTIGGSADLQDDLTPLYVIAYLDSEITLEGTTYHFTGGNYNGILNGIMFIVGDAEMINGILFDINVNQGLGNNIMTVFTIPKFACSQALNNSVTGKNYIVLAGDTFQQAITETFVSTPSNLDGYIPVNQKLRTFPYVYLGFNPQTGNKKVFRYEDFSNGTPSFKMISEINQNPIVYFIPQNYKNITGDNVAECCSLSGFPTISWKTDYFNSWLAQNSTILGIQMSQEAYNYEIGQVKSAVNTTANIVKSGLSLDVVGAVSAGATGGLDLASNQVNHEFYIQNQLAQVEKQQMLPDNGSMGGSNATLFGYGMFKNIFNRYTIKAQFAKRIDKFFSMYGYLTNEVKLPNLNNRSNWNYVKTIGANIVASIPQEDLQALKNLFDNGITLWHNASTFLDYSQSNT